MEGKRLDTNKIAIIVNVTVMNAFQFIISSA